MARKDNKSLNVSRFYKAHKKIISTFLIFFVVASMFLMGNSLRPLSSPDEARYTEIPREMLASGDFVTPRLNGVKYFEKPPLFYWMQACTIKLFGISNWSARLWHAIIGVFGCFCVFLAGKSLFSGRIGLFSAIALASSILYYALAKFVCLDMIFSAFFTASLLCFMAAFNRAVCSKNLFNALVCGGYAFVGLAFLTKGLVSIVLVGIILIFFISITRQWRHLKLIAHPGILIFLAIALPWHITVAIKNPGFNYQYFVYEHFIRYTTTAHNRYREWWFFFPIMAIGLLPWTGILASGIANSLSKLKTIDRNMLFLLVWFIVPIAFFSCSGSKLIPYVLPSVPAASMIIAIKLDQLVDSKTLHISWGYILIDLTLGLSALFYLAREGFQDYQPPELVYMLVFGCAVVLAAAVPYFTKNPLSFIKSKLVLISCAYAFLSYAIPSVQENNKPSVVPLIRIIQENLKKGDLIFCFYSYYQELPLYTGKFVGLVDNFDELEFGAHAEKVYDRFLILQQFWELWEGEKRIFAIMKKQNYERFWENRRHRVLACDKKNIVLTNR
ncbi:MAG: glycosyltransferase family 39 protein [Holosporales bacterium]|jgi:4-amino-4-deoxy-L-arabinose transferase-like glycosyltransferase|nr:glycosyltransferase family 39 protein [Holosporales bacterium]